MCVCVGGGAGSGKREAADKHVLVRRGLSASSIGSISLPFPRRGRRVALCSELMTLSASLVPPVLSRWNLP